MGGVVVQVTLGSQKHTSNLKLAEEDGGLTYDLKCPFVAQVPVKNRIIKMELYRTSRRTKSGKLLATACIPMFQLMGFSTGALSDVTDLSTRCCSRLAVHCIPYQ